MYDPWTVLKKVAPSLANKWGSEVELFKLATFVQLNVLPDQPLDAAYVFSNTPDLEQGMLDTAADFIKEKHAGILCICGLPAMAGPDDAGHHIAYRGADAWVGELEDRGVESGDILVIAQNDPTPHTGTEANHFVETCAARSWKSVAIVVHPTHALRAFVSTVTPVVRSGVDVRVHVITSKDTSWSEKALYSQHGERRKRIDMLEGELERLNHWHAKGDLISAAEVLAYLEKRIQ